MRITAAALSTTLLALVQAFPQQQTPLVSPSTSHKNKHAIHADNIVPLLRLHQQLISIESISGNEYAVGAYIVRYLHDLGLSVEVQPVELPSSKSASTLAEETYEPFSLLTSQLDEQDSYLTTSTTRKHKLPKRFNIFAYTNASAAGHHHTLLTTHIDTVPPFYPYSTNTSSYHDDTLISGRGSVDAKGSLAAMLTAWTSLLTPPPKAVCEDNSALCEAEREASLKFPADSTALLLVVGEETGGQGMRAASKAFAISSPPTTFDVGIFGEPTESTLACGHKGNLGIGINVHGRAAHSGYPWLGVSANDVLVAALGSLKFKATWPSSEKYGNTTVNIGKIEGGVAGNVVAERAKANIQIRIADGKPDAIKKIVRETVDEATKEWLKDGEGVTKGEVEVVFPDGGYGPVDCDCDVDGFETMTVNYGKP